MSKFNNFDPYSDWFIYGFIAVVVLSSPLWGGLIVQNVSDLYWRWWL